MFQVERILKTRTVKVGTGASARLAIEHLVKWKDFDKASNTWEPEENLAEAKDKIKDFRKKNKK
jgi:hypothetical protein